MYQGTWFYVENVMNSLLLIGCVYLFLLPLKRMEGRRLYAAAVLLVDAVLMILLGIVLQGAPAFLILVLRPCLAAGGVQFLFRELSWEGLYCGIWPVMIYHLVHVFWTSIARRLSLFTHDAGRTLALQFLFFAVCYLILEFTIIHWMPRNGKYQAGPRRTLSAIFVLMLSMYSYYSFFLMEEASLLNVLVQFYCVTFLYMQAELFKKSEINQELDMMERLWYQQKRQYEIAKDQMQVIDRKCHDLKYQIEAMRHIDDREERERNLLELEQSIRIYDAIVKTGNEILDTLLSEKSLVCEARDITMHCVIDGEPLFYLDTIDIYSLFGNAIDNAIECVERFQDRERRYVDVCVARKQNFIYIRIANPIAGDPVYEGDLPKTSKRNTNYHGFGLKSIRHIAEKYGGEISVSTEMGCFLLEILLPKSRT